MKKQLGFILLLLLLLSFAACDERQELHEPFHWHPSPPPEPDWLHVEKLSMQEARLDPALGAHVPFTFPDDFHFLFAHRIVTPGIYHWAGAWYMSSGIMINWQTEGGHLRASPPNINAERERVAGRIELLISEATENDRTRIVSPDDDGGWEADWVPVFLAEELTPYAVEARFEWFDHFGDSYLITSGSGFGVLFGDVLVQIRTFSALPEEIWTMLAEIGAGQ